MKIINRIYNYLEEKGLSAYEFERTCEISNGYLNSRKGGTRGIGSEILEKVYRKYPDLNLIWLVTGEGKMLIDPQAQPQAQLQAQPKKSVKETTAKEDHSDKPLSPEYVIQVLQSQISVLTATVEDKSQIIAMLREKLKQNETGKK